MTLSCKDALLPPSGQTRGGDGRGGAGSGGRWLFWMDIPEVVMLLRELD